MTCPTHKRCYLSREMAEQALLENRSRNYYAENDGPINVYECDICGYFHFTSKGEKSDILKSNEAIEKIDKSREASYWEDRFRRR